MLIFGISLPWILLKGRGIPEDAGIAGIGEYKLLEMSGSGT
jgi:hypothetical protein